MSALRAAYLGVPHPLCISCCTAAVTVLLLTSYKAFYLEWQPTFLFLAHIPKCTKSFWDIQSSISVHITKQGISIVTNLNFDFKI